MAEPCATLSDLKEEELKNKQIQPLAHSPEGGASSVMAGAASQKRKRNSPGNPSKICCESNCFFIYFFLSLCLYISKKKSSIF